MCAFRWFIFHNCITMHGANRNVNFNNARFIVKHNKCEVRFSSINRMSVPKIFTF